MDTKTTIENRLKILPEKLQTFIIDESWGNTASEISKQFKLDEKKYINFEDEIFYVLLCFEFRSNFVKNIKNELGIEQNLAEQVASEVERNIFSKVTGELDAVEKQIEENEKGAGPQKGVGSDFEKIIRNQAQAMKPAVAPQERSFGEAKPAVPTANLPTQSSEPRKLHDYPTGNDPYREPAE